MSTHVSCPQCGRIILDQQNDGSLRIRTRLILIPSRREVVIAVCPQCKQSVHLPLKLFAGLNRGGEAVG